VHGALHPEEHVAARPGRRVTETYGEWRTFLTGQH
jgi:hypothetical protein